MDPGACLGNHQQKIEWKHSDSFMMTHFIFFQLIQCPPISGLIQEKQFNSSPPGQNGCHFTDDIFRCIFMNDNFCILNKVSLRFVHRVQLTITWYWFRYWLGPNRWQAIIWTNADPIQWCIYAALGGDELITSWLIKWPHLSCKLFIQTTDRTQCKALEICLCSPLTMTFPLSIQKHNLDFRPMMQVYINCKLQCSTLTVAR